MSGWPYFFLPLSAVPQGCQFSTFLLLVPCHYTFIFLHREVYFFVDSPLICTFVDVKILYQIYS